MAGIPGSNLAVPRSQAQLVDPDAGAPPPAPLRVQNTVAKLYARGYTRGQIARKCYPWLNGPSERQRPKDQQIRRAQLRLRKLELLHSFRDLIWQYAVGELDMKTPAILEGVARKAEAGRVDAARLSLELTKRHVTKGEGAPTQVAIVVNGVPRPVVSSYELDEGDE